MQKDQFIFDPIPQPTLPVVGSDKLFPVHRIYCVGRNYADHAIEMGTTRTANHPSFSRRTRIAL